MLLVMLAETDFVTLFADVIHTVGPKGEKPDKLESCYRNSLEVLIENQLRTVVRYYFCMRCYK
jgi:O-acetyl-ADP-ribose deacetylase (regulator of RNase III)